MNVKRSALKTVVKSVIREAYNAATQYALGYRQAQDNYHDENLLKDFTGYNKDFQTGYKAGIKDARRNKWDDRVRRFLIGLGDIMRGNFGNRSGDY